MLQGDVVLVHGFWSSPATWNRFLARAGADPELAGLRFHTFAYESPRLPRLPFSTVAIPNYDSIAQSLPTYLEGHTADGDPIAVVTHSQGGLILQRFLAYMLRERRGHEVARMRLAVLLACPNQGSDFLRSIRALAGFGRHPQARELRTLSDAVTDAQRVVLRQIVNATVVAADQCPVPFYVYAGRTDKVVPRASAQAAFPRSEVLPGDHFSILDVDAAGNETFATVKRLLLKTMSTPAAPSTETVPEEPKGSTTAAAKYDVRIGKAHGVQIGDGNIMYGDADTSP